MIEDENEDKEEEEEEKEEEEMEEKPDKSEWGSNIVSNSGPLGYTMMVKPG